MHFVAAQQRGLSSPIPYSLESARVRVALILWWWYLDGPWRIWANCNYACNYEPASAVRRSAGLPTRTVPLRRGSEGTQPSASPLSVPALQLLDRLFVPSRDGRDDSVELCKGDDRSPCRPSGSAQPSDSRKLGNIANPRPVDLAAPEHASHSERLAVVSCADSIAADRDNDTNSGKHSRTDEVAVNGGFEPPFDAEPDQHAAGQHVGDARDQQRSKFHNGNGASRGSTPRSHGARGCRRTPSPLIVGLICSTLLVAVRNCLLTWVFAARSRFVAATRFLTLPVESRAVSRPGSCIPLCGRGCELTSIARSTGSNKFDSWPAPR